MPQEAERTDAGEARQGPPPIGQGVLAQAGPPGNTRPVLVLLVFLGFCAFVAIVANREAIWQGLKKMGATPPADKTEAASASDAVPTDTCGTLERWRICVVEVKRRKSISDGFRRWGSRKDSVYLTVKIKIAHDERSAQSTMGLDFDIGDADGNRYSVDEDIPFYLRIGDDSVCSPLGEDINPGYYSECWAVFYLTRGTPGIHLIARGEGREVLLSLGEAK